MFVSLVAAGILFITAYIVGKNYIERNVLTAKYCGKEYSVPYDIVPAKIENVVWDSSSQYSLECMVDSKTKVSIKLPLKEVFSDISSLPSMYIYLIQIISDKYIGYKPVSPLTITENSNLSINKTEETTLLGNKEILAKLKQIDIAITAGILFSIMCVRSIPIISVGLCAGIIYASHKNRNLLNWTKDNNLCIIKAEGLNKGKKSDSGNQREKKDLMLSEFEYSLIGVESRLISNLSKRQNSLTVDEKDALSDKQKQPSEPEPLVFAARVAETSVNPPVNYIAEKSEDKKRQTGENKPRTTQDPNGDVHLVDVKVNRRIRGANAPAKKSDDVVYTHNNKGEKNSRTGNKNKKDSELAELLEGVGNSL